MKKKILLSTFYFLLLIFSSSLYSQTWLWGREPKPKNDSIGKGEVLFDHSIAVDYKGDVYEVGSFAGQIVYGNDTLTKYKSAADLFLSKYDGNGNILWARQIKTSIYGAPTPRSVAVDDSGNAFITGEYNDSIAFGPIQFAYQGGEEDVFIAKYYANGNVAWAKQFTTISIFSYTDGVSLAADHSGNIYLAGDYSDSVSFQSDTLFTAQSDDSYLAKLNGNGSLQWIRTTNCFSRLSYCAPASVAVDRAGDAYITGLFDDSISMGKDTISTITHSGDLFVAKYDPAGNVLWASSAIAKNGLSQSIPFSISVDRYGDAYITGSFYDTVSFNSDMLTETKLNYNVFLAKFAGSNGKARWGIQGENTGITLWQGESISSDTLATGGGVLLVDGQNTPFKLNFNNDTVNSKIPYSTADAIIQFDSSGHVTCSSTFSEGYEDDGDAIATGSSGKYTYVGGDLFDTIVFGPDTLPYGGDVPFVIRWQSCVANALSLSAIVDSVCGNSCNGVASITPTGGVPPYTYLWSNGQTTQKDTGLCAGTYSVTVTDSLGEKLTTPLTIINAILKPQINPVKDSICRGDSVQLIASGGTTYTWSTGSTSNTIWVKPDSTSIYILHAFKGMCADSTSAAVYIRPKITASISIQDSVVCPHDTSFLIVKANNGPATYRWSNGASSSSIHVNDTVSTTYTVTVHGVCDSLTFIKKITVVPLSNPIISGITYKCKGLIDTLTVSGGISYLWNNGSTNTKYYTGPIYTDSTITVIAYNSLHCPDTAHFTISPKLPPGISIPLSFTSCSGSQVVLKPKISGIGPYTYSWSPGGETTDSITVTDAASKMYTVTVSNGCADSSSVLVKTDNPILHACCDGVIFMGEDTTIVASGNGIIKYQWADTNGVVCLNPICDSIRVTPTVTTTYTVTGTDSSGCTIEKVITIIVKEICGKLTVPNVFTPDYPGPYGRNNLFYIKTEAIDTWSLMIYDRWGKEMYNSNNPTQYWNGNTESASKAPDGVYYYIINATCQSTTYKKDGFVQVIR